MLRIDVIDWSLASLNALDWLNFFLADVRGGWRLCKRLLLTKANGARPRSRVLASSGLIGIMAHPRSAPLSTTHGKAVLIIAGIRPVGPAACDRVDAVLPVGLSRTSSWLSRGCVFAPPSSAITSACVDETLPARLAATPHSTAPAMSSSQPSSGRWVAYSQRRHFISRLFAALRRSQCSRSRARIDHDKPGSRNGGVPACRDS